MSSRCKKNLQSSSDRASMSSHCKKNFQSSSNIASMSSPCKKNLQSSSNRASVSSLCKKNFQSSSNRASTSTGLAAAATSGLKNFNSPRKMLSLISASGENCNPNASPKIKGLGLETNLSRRNNNNNRAGISNNTHNRSASDLSPLFVKPSPKKSLFGSATNGRCSPKPKTVEHGSEKPRNVKQVVSSTAATSGNLNIALGLIREQCHFYCENQGSTVEEEMDLSLRKKEIVHEEAMEKAPPTTERGTGRVKKLVQAFERLMLPSSKQPRKENDQQQTKHKREDNDDDNGQIRVEKQPAGKVVKCALPGMQGSTTSVKTQTQNVTAHRRVNSASFMDSYADFKYFPLQTSPYSSADKSDDVDSVGLSVSGSGRRRCRESFDSNKQSRGGKGKFKMQLKPKSTATKPFQLRTEERGAIKKEEFNKKMNEIIEEECRLRNIVASRLPLTTYEPEIVPKAPVKESTKPFDIKLHTKFRAVERAEFDHTVADKIKQMEEKWLEQKRREKLAEEEEIKRMRRKDLIPKAQPMPYFDRPFRPRKSGKPPTTPQEPKFHIPSHKRAK